MGWLEGSLRRVVWRSEDSGYAVVRIQDVDGTEIAAVGELSVFAEQPLGTFAVLEGRFEDHPHHGRQFRASGVLQGSPRTEQGLVLYLGSSGIKGVGPALAQRIVARFGMSTPRVLAETPERLVEVDGIGPKRAEAISEIWRRDEAGRALQVTLRGLGVSGRHIEAIRRAYGDRAGDVVLRDPYRLAAEIRGIGFRTADRLARELGIPADDPARVGAAVAYVLDQASGEGHCFLPAGRMRSAVADLGVPTAGIEAAVDEAEGAGRLVVERDGGDRTTWLPALHRAEATVARELVYRAKGASEPRLGVGGEVARAERALGMELDPDQRAAVEAALEGGVVVVTGGPGTGKTTLVRVLVYVAEQRGADWHLASPTGRAAKRLEQASGQPASTLHRLLEYRPGEGGFQRRLTNPLDGDGLVVDEVSMVDVELMSALLDALPHGRPDFTLVLVGDADQLPSVGPGQVLRDLIASGTVRTVRLGTMHRQAEQSGILYAAREVHAGRVPRSGQTSGYDDFFLVPRDDATRARAVLLQIVSERLPKLGFDAVHDVQVLAPTRRGPLGTEQLNAVLQARLNPGQEAADGELELRVGDRVLCTRNRYDLDVFNGDTGVVLEVGSAGVYVQFEGRTATFAKGDRGSLDLAYAMTVHKSQGSEYPAVVLALHDGHGIMLRRNLLYTAMTRARRFLCVVGSERALRRATQQAGGDERWTRLAERCAAASELSAS